MKKRTDRLAFLPDGGLPITETGRLLWLSGVSGEVGTDHLPTPPELGGN